MQRINTLFRFVDEKLDSVTVHEDIVYLINFYTELDWYKKKEDKQTKAETTTRQCQNV